MQDVITMVLLEVTPDSFMPVWADKLTLVGVLSFFLWYFIKEIKDERALRNKFQSECDEKAAKMFERIIDLEKQSIKILEDVTASNNNLTSAVNSLNSKLGK